MTNATAEPESNNPSPEQTAPTSSQQSTADNSNLQKHIEFAQIEAKVKEGFGFYGFLVMVFLILSGYNFLKNISFFQSPKDIFWIAFSGLEANAFYLARQARKNLDLAKQRTAILRFKIILIVKALCIIVPLVYLYLSATQYLSKYKGFQDTVHEYFEQSTQYEQQFATAIAEIKNSRKRDPSQDDIARTIFVTGHVVLAVISIIPTVISILFTAIIYSRAKKILQLLVRRKELLQEIPASEFPK